jgi:hypothetical protein
MMLKIGKEQFINIQLEYRKAQRRILVIEYTNEIKSHDPQLAEQIRSMDKEVVLNLFNNIYNLTSDKYYQRALLALLISTKVNIFELPEFSYIIHHPFLIGDAKARHIIFSSIITKKTS